MSSNCLKIRRFRLLNVSWKVLEDGVWPCIAEFTPEISLISFNCKFNSS